MPAFSNNRDPGLGIFDKTVLQIHPNTIIKVVYCNFDKSWHQHFTGDNEQQVLTVQPSLLRLPKSQAHHDRTAKFKVQQVITTSNA